MARSTYDDFLIKDKIGSGSYGVVYKVIRKVDRCVHEFLLQVQAVSRMHVYYTMLGILASPMVFTNTGVDVQAGLRNEGNRSTRDDTEGERLSTPSRKPSFLRLCCSPYTNVLMLTPKAGTVYASDLPLA